MWIVGDATLHWDGSAWTASSSGTTLPLSGVWSDGARVWAVGDRGTVLSHGP